MSVSPRWRVNYLSKLPISSEFFQSGVPKRTTLSCHPPPGDQGRRVGGTPLYNLDGLQPFEANLQIY